MSLQTFTKFFMNNLTIKNYKEYFTTLYSNFVLSFINVNYMFNNFIIK